MAALSLSIIIPAYNEARRLPATLEALNEYLDARHPDAEVVVADDGSADATGEHTREAARRWSRIRLLEMPHRGKGHAVRQGMLAALGEVRLFMDADRAVPLEAIEPFLEAMSSADVVIASREAPGARRIGEPPNRHLMGRVFNLAVRLMAGLPYRDTQCGFKAFRASAAQALFSRQQVDGFGFDAEVLYLARRLGLRVVELPVEWRYGVESKVRLRHPVQMLGELAGVRWRALRGGYEAPSPKG